MRNEKTWLGRIRDQVIPETFSFHRYGFKKAVLLRGLLGETYLQNQQETHAH
jgi:hypothetical protein